MINSKRFNRFSIIMMIELFSLSLVSAGQFIAFSMREAERQIKLSGKANREILELGGMTRVAGLVYDAKNKDLILVGQKNEVEKGISLDDFVIALRALRIHKEWPEVSIEKTEKTGEAGKQKIRFQGGIENTRFGKDLLDADVILKKLALEYLPTEIWGVQSYFSLAVERLKKTEDRRIFNTRFWFYPMIKKRDVGVAEDVIILRDFKIGVEARLIGVKLNGEKISELGTIRNEVGDRFAQSLSATYDDIAAYYPPVERVRALLRTVAIAYGIDSLKSQPNLSFWLSDYDLKQIHTDQDFDVLRKKEKIQLDGEEAEFEIEGGITLKVMLSRLTEDGDITVMRDIVLGSRRSLHDLTWHLPLNGWNIPGYPVIAEAAAEEQSLDRSRFVTQPGCSISERLLSRGTNNEFRPTDIRISYPQSPVPNLNITNSIAPQRFTPDVGGVMLQNVARISGTDEAKVDLTGGSFSLVVGGENARLAPETFRKFVTALWAVYYDNEDPGISIDPIAPGAKKHMVRYIGKVVNTDLGRVMREADYLMKQWSVGTAKAAVPGFKNPDDYAADEGTLYVNAWSRFWFVPEDMRFKRGGDMLLFDDGRMTVKTEYMFQDEGARADPSNEKFAQFFTEHYNEIAAKYPVYKELFDYAKIVSLAKFLKESGVPLYWFLMANKDLVMTEDSPGSVDALAKGSEHFEGVYIEGGVDLKTKGKYVYDKATFNAINDAYANLPSVRVSTTSLTSKEKLSYTSNEPFSFNVGKSSYTVVPQHSLTSGKDRRGIRYQTDIALKAEGFKMTKITLAKLCDDIRYYEALRLLKEEMESLNLRPPYDEEQLITLANEAGIKAQKKIEVIGDRLDELIDQEFKTESDLIDAVEKKLGEDQTTEIKTTILKHAYYKTDLELVRYFNPRYTETGDFGKGWNLLVPYQIRQIGDAKKEFSGLLLPTKMAVENLVTGDKESLTFSEDRYTIAGYVPDNISASQVVGLFMMSDASFRLADKLGNEFWFDQAGYLTDLIFSEDHHFHFEYLDGFTDAFEQPPYQIQSVGDETIEFLNVRVPKSMNITALADGWGDTLSFSETGNIAGYIPMDTVKSRFRFLALMSDGSFRLLDKVNNELSFDLTGKFIGMAISSGRPIVSSFTQGKHKIKFKYILDGSGELLIAGAYLSKEDGELKPAAIVNYQYDAEGRLYRVEGPANKLAKREIRNGEKEK